MSEFLERMNARAHVIGEQLERIDTGTQRGEGEGQLLQQVRLTSTQIRALGGMLTLADLQPVFGLKLTQLTRYEKAGALDLFKLQPQLFGPLKFSAELLAQYVDGQPFRLSDVAQRRSGKRA